MWLNTAKNNWILPVNELTAEVIQAVRQAAHRYLYVLVNSNAMNGVDKTKVLSNIMQIWQKLAVAGAFLGFILSLALLYTAYRLWSSKKCLARQLLKQEKRRLRTLNSK